MTKIKVGDIENDIPNNPPISRGLILLNHSRVVRVATLYPSKDARRAEILLRADKMTQDQKPTRRLFVYAGRDINILNTKTVTINIIHQTPTRKRKKKKKP